MPRNQNYKADLLADLRADPRFAAEYISAAYVDSQEAFLVALRDVAEARVGIARVAKGAKLNRENLYRVLSKDGNPRLSTLGSVLDTLGMHLEVKPGPAPEAAPQAWEAYKTLSEPVAVEWAGTSLIGQLEVSELSGYLTMETNLDVPIPISGMQAGTCQLAA